MNLGKRKPSGREKDERSIKLLGLLREKLYSAHITTARRAAYNLSWMQEDGLDILREALFSEAAGRTKAAAAYGLRNMHGRMKAMALGALEQGLQDTDGGTKRVCRRALALAGRKQQEKFARQGRAKPGGLKIREIPTKGRRPRGIQKKGGRRTPSASGRLSQRHQGGRSFRQSR